MKKNIFILLVIILISTFLRFYQISTNPRALYGDSLTGVYDAYSIYKTGHDQKGNFLPVVFSLGGGRPGGYIYATVPFAALFGPTALASRMISVLSGIGIVILLFLLGKKFSEKIGLTIAALAAVNPWALSLSRGPFETHFALFLTLLGFYFFILGLKRKIFFIFFALSFGLAIHTYSTYKLVVPVFTFFLLIWTTKYIDKKLLKKPFVILSVVLITLFTLLSVYFTVSRGNQDRFYIINIFKDPAIRSSISQKVNSELMLDSLSPSVASKLHTPYIELMAVIAENYFQNLMPDFLFLHGDRQVRHNPAEMGGFYWIDIILLVFGIIYLFKINKPVLVLLIGWILIAPIATSLVGGPHALRSSFLLPPILILSGVGLYRLWTTRTKPYLALVCLLLVTIFTFQFILFIDRFYFVSPQKHSNFWSYPAKKAVLIALKNYHKFDYIILSNDIDNMEFAYPVYAKLDPKLVINQNTKPAKIGEYSFFQYGKVYIGSLPSTRVIQFIKDLPGSVLYIGAAKEQPYLENYKVLRNFSKEPELIISSKSQIPDLLSDEK